MKTNIYFMTQHEGRKNTKSPDFLQTRRINRIVFFLTALNITQGEITARKKRRYAACAHPNLSSWFETWNCCGLMMHLFLVSWRLRKLVFSTLERRGKKEEKLCLSVPLEISKLVLAGAKSPISFTKGFCENSPQWEEGAVQEYNAISHC